MELPQYSVEWPFVVETLSGHPPLCLGTTSRFGKHLSQANCIGADIVEGVSAATQTIGPGTFRVLLLAHPSTDLRPSFGNPTLAKGQRVMNNPSVSNYNRHNFV